MARLLVVSSSVALGLRLAETHQVINESINNLDSIIPDPSIDVMVLAAGRPAEAIEAVRRLRAADVLTPVLLVAGYQRGWRALPAVQRPGVIVVPLPITRRGLLEGVDRLLADKAEKAEEAEEAEDHDSVDDVPESSGAEPQQTLRLLPARSVGSAPSVAGSSRAGENATTASAVRAVVNQSDSDGSFLPGPKLAWAALFANVLAFSHLPTVVPIPGAAGQLITQGALPLALVLALLANRRAVIRPSLFLVLLTMLAVVALMVSVHNEFLLGSTFRASRLLGFILVLWLLTPWWGRAELTILRCHLKCLRVVLYTVLVGAVLSPGAAFSYEGRLSGALWPIPPTQVAHYAGVLLGATVVLWFCGAASGRRALLTVAGAGAALAGTHTRTALGATVLGLAVAGASLFVGHARVRRTSALVAVLAVLVGTFLGPLLVAWASRGQSAQEASQLTGRTKVWSSIFETRRPLLEQFFGSGLSNKSFGGLPIDSNWVATYLDQGWFGVCVEVMFLLFLLLLAVAHPRGLRRAVALFLIVYCLVASFTETGLGDASPYLLELVVAATLLAPPVRTVLVSAVRRGTSTTATASTAGAPSSATDSLPEAPALTSSMGRPPA